MTKYLARSNLREEEFIQCTIEGKGNSSSIQFMGCIHHDSEEDSHIASTVKAMIAGAQF